MHQYDMCIANVYAIPVLHLRYIVRCKHRRYVCTALVSKAFNWFNFDLMSIWFKNQFNLILNCFSSHSKILTIWKLANFQRYGPSRRQKYLTISSVIPFSELLFSCYHSWGFFLLTFLSRSSWIELYWKLKIWFDLIWFKQNIQIDKQIRFDLDSIWQPW
jgi:hypothetical protein